ncbi:Acyl-CoA Binding Protein [Zostera marina]|uniref:Acyl-CoA Binding Protein n=1 Tax=Zostera marina TaxID=29655 RepID=A0A0K9PG25_ZOSMR|nr:Acyl-CoA Binding Protein [Zostera marina]
MVGNWQELIQTVVIGLIFSYLVAKLISTVVNFREENLKVVREDDVLAEEESSSAPSADADSLKIETPGVSEGKILEDVSEDDYEDRGKKEEEEDEEDDWEGVESTELDEVFSAASVFIAATVSDRSNKVSNDVQLQLYGLYKIATEGPCTVPQPSAFKMTARAKWNAWHGMGAMPTEEAMEKYVEIVIRLYPDWGSPSASKTSESGNASKTPMGPVFSSFVHEEASDDELKLDVVHVSAREGKAEDLIKHLENGVSVNLRDSDERTALHWAVDRGHLHLVDILISNGADINAKDNEGQTPLHYAALCEREAVAEFLVEHRADVNMKDNDGSTPADLIASSWNFMTCVH